VLALWSYGMVVARSCALTAVSGLLGALLDREANSVRQQLREFCYEASAKRGRQRQTLDVTTCFVPLLRWVLSWWQGQHLALALDATHLGDRFVVLVVSVLYQGCAIPVGWAVVRADQRGSWRPVWLRLLRQLRPAVPPAYTVIVLADRGLYAAWLFRRIVRLGWHPLLRVNLGGSFRPATQHQFHPLRAFVSQPGRRWSGTGVAFKSARCRLACTLLASWEEGYAEPWLLLTDLPPAGADAGWYGLRAWIEQGFKCLKRGGFQWQHTRMTDPARAERLWLAVAVAMLWLLSVGGEADACRPLAAAPDLAAVTLPARKRRTATRLRLVSVVRSGWNCILAALLRHDPLPLGAFRPEPWPIPAAHVTDTYLPF